jgi:hypothetical protein
MPALACRSEKGVLPTNARETGEIRVGGEHLRPTSFGDGSDLGIRRQIAPGTGIAKPLQRLIDIRPHHGQQFCSRNL